jgi:hypothetical protein
MTGSINGGTQKTREGKEYSSANRNKPAKKVTSRNKRSGAFTKRTNIISTGSEGSLLSLGSVTENEEFKDQGKDPMITVTRRICFAATAATNNKYPILELLSVDYDGKEEPKEPKERQPPPIVQGPAKSSSTTELDNISAVNLKNIIPRPRIKYTF